jgi:UDP-N-acetylmuramoyl-tripeptide--D-alanyl-D-alanine ligase
MVKEALIMQKRAKLRQLKDSISLSSMNSVFKKFPKKIIFKFNKSKDMKKQLIEKFFQTRLVCDFDQLIAETDSKRVKPGTIFFALEGKNTDGHFYLKEAEQNGAILLVVKQQKELPPLEVPVIRVENPLEILQMLAKLHILFMQPKVIAVTGSNGKSTTKEYIAQLLDGHYRVGKTKGNRNSQVGLALSIIEFSGDEEIVVLEMGMSEKGNIEKLMQIAMPEIAVLTNIDVNHIENLGSKEAIAEEKSTIFLSDHLQRAYVEEGAYQYPIVQERVKDKAVIYSVDRCVLNGAFTVDDFSIPLTDLAIKQGHFLKNLIPAVSIAKFLEVPNEKILERINALKTLEHRFQLVTNKKCLVIDDSYNSSLESLFQAVQNIQKQQISGKKIAVIGALLEQGEHEVNHHEKIAEILEGKFEQVYCIGIPTLTTVKVLKEKGKNAAYVESIQDLADLINQDIQYNDLVFIKGANKFRLWELVDLISS